MCDITEITGTTRKCCQPPTDEQPANHCRRFLLAELRDATEELVTAVEGLAHE